MSKELWLLVAGDEDCPTRGEPQMEETQLESS